MSSNQDQKGFTSTLEDKSQKDSTTQAQAASTASAAQIDAAPKTEPTATDGAQSTTTNAQPLAPPPKPSQNNAADPDYFGATGGSHFSREPNPFEQSFGVPTNETPGKFGGLPSVASLQSPAPLGPGKTPGWPDSLRSGPLSPAMLAGPANTGDYFGEHNFGSFPTPNESSLRTGLTPGGTGSMFPAPSPNSQAIFNSMQSGGATPSTLDFQRTAMQAAARSKIGPTSTSVPTTQGGYQPAQQPDQSNMFSQPEGDAANSLYMLATRSGSANQFAQSGQNGMSMGGQSQNTSPTSRRGKQSMGGNSASDGGDYSGSENADSKPSTRSKGKKGSNAKNASASNGRRKAEETPSKSNKRSKTNGAPSVDSDDSDMDAEMSHVGENGRKMTDEEKRKNFLERNRVAALKCRQRKKQWLANLQNKVEIFSAENDALSQQVTQLREEIVNLKTLLLAHKDCPVSHQQGLGGAAMQQVIGEIGHPPNPYGMLAGGGQMLGMTAPQAMQRA